MNITASAPGKLMLFGEHAVVYNRPCLVTAVNQRMRVTVEMTDEDTFALDAQDVKIAGYSKPMEALGNGKIPKGAHFVEIAARNFRSKYPFAGGVKISTASEFSAQFGFGSSSASTVCVLKAFSEAVGKKLTEKQLFALAHKTALDIQGKGSGFDMAAAIYGGTLYFVTGGKMTEPLNVKNLPLVISYTGVKADTVTFMREVEEKMKLQPERVNRIYDAIAKLVEDAKRKLLEGDWERVGKLMDFNQEYLRDLGVSSEKLETLISAAKGAGAWGAKLSGAGGGDCMIALAPPNKRKAIEEAIGKAGGQVIHIDTGAPGVCVETDDQNELFVVVDEHDTVIGHRTRRDCHQDPSLIHRSVGVLIFDTNGRVLLQKRSQNKDTYPGYWGLSCAGHVEKGETYKQTVLRELQEELGISTPVEFHSKRIDKDLHETEMEALFAATHNGPFYPNPKEIEEVKFFDKREIQFGLSSHKLKLTSAAIHNLKLLHFV